MIKNRTILSSLLTDTIITGSSAFLLILNAFPAGAFTTFFGEDDSETTGNPSFPAIQINSEAAEAEFLSNLVGVETEGFEFPVGERPASIEILDFGVAGNGTINGGPSGQIISNDRVVVNGEAPFGGAFAPKGNQAYFTDILDGFVIDFSQPTAALGFYINDLETGVLQANLTLASGGNQSVTFNNNVVPNIGNGSVHYFSFIAENFAETFTRADISFVGGQSGDGIVVDDITIGNLQQVVKTPESNSIFSLLIIGGLAAGTIFKKKQSV